MEGRRPVGWPKKTWSKVVGEDLKIETVEATHLTSNCRSGKLGTVNKDGDDNM